MQDIFFEADEFSFIVKMPKNKGPRTPNPCFHVVNNPSIQISSRSKPSNLQSLLSPVPWYHGHER